MSDYKEQRLKDLQKKLEAEKRKIEAKAEIFNLLPYGCPEPRHIFISSLYGVEATIRFGGDSSNRDKHLKDLGLISELFPAIPLVRTAEGSTFASIIPNFDKCKEIYCKKNSVAGWDPAGKYVFRTDYVEPSGLFGGNLCKVEWYTLLDGRVLEVEVDLDYIASSVIQYWKNPCKDTYFNPRVGEWSYRVSNRFSSGISRIAFWSSEKGRNPLSIYHPDGLSLFEMFDFTGLIPEGDNV